MNKYKRGKMFFITKVQTVIVVCIVWSISVGWERSVPYFPIEISRTAGSSQLAHTVFIWGIISLLPTLLYESFVTFHAVSETLILGNPLFIWPFILSIAWFDDKRHFVLHNVSVSCMLFMVACHAITGENRHLKIPIFVCVQLLAAVSVLMKAIGIIYMEFEHPWQSLRFPSVVTMANRTISVMYEGAANEMDAMKPIFQVTGAMQWLAFYLLSSLY